MKSKPKLAAIVAMSENRVIGIKNTLPWHLSEDLKHFKAVTMGKPIIMGRLTFESIGKPLAGRTNIVVTHQNHWSYENTLVAGSLEEAIALAYKEAEGNELKEVMIVGGANIYHQALPLLDVVYVTEIHETLEGDAFFPELDAADWSEERREGPYKSEKNGLPYSFVIFQKRPVP